MSKFFEFVSANLRLAGNLMISPSERFHAGHLTSNVSGLAFEGLRGVTESFNAAAHSVSKKAHKSLWATFCDSIDFSESIAAFSLMAAPSERTSVAAQSLWTTYCNSSAYAETRMPQAAKKEATSSKEAEVMYVEYYVDGVRVGKITEAPFQLNYRLGSISTGRHLLLTKVYWKAKRHRFVSDFKWNLDILPAAD